MRHFVALSSSFYSELGQYYDEAINQYLDGFLTKDEEDEEEAA